MEKDVEIEKIYLDRTPTSKRLFGMASNLTPAGVHSSERVFQPYPIFAARARGSRLYDVDGNEYVDFCMGYGAVFLGHSHPSVVRAVQEQAENGAIYGTSCELETKLAQKVIKMIPCAKMVRFSNSGTEALMYAMRIARGFTKRDKIVKFEGNFHGGWDSLNTATKNPYDKPMSSGLTKNSLADTILLPFNDSTAVEDTLKKEEIAAIVIEPILGSGGSGIMADLEFLKFLREITREKGVLLVFDEVITGFRVSTGGAQKLFGVTPDMACLGKILGGGHPIGAIAASKEIMEVVDPTRPKVPRWECANHGGTFCGNPITMSAGLATLEEVDKANGRLNTYVGKLADLARKELNALFEKHRVRAQAIGIGPVLGIYFTDQKLTNPRILASEDGKMRALYIKWLIAHGVWHPKMLSWHVSTAHEEADIITLIEKTGEFLDFIK